MISIKNSHFLFYMVLLIFYFFREIFRLFFRCFLNIIIRNTNFRSWHESLRIRTHIHGHEDETLIKSTLHTYIQFAYTVVTLAKDQRVLGCYYRLGSVLWAHESIKIEKPSRRMWERQRIRGKEMIRESGKAAHWFQWELLASDMKGREKRRKSAVSAFYGNIKFLLNDEGKVLTRMLATRAVASTLSPRSPLYLWHILSAIKLFSNSHSLHLLSEKDSFDLSPCFLLFRFSFCSPITSIQRFEKVWRFLMQIEFINWRAAASLAREKYDSKNTSRRR